jgi:hypothetical protein
MSPRRRSKKRSGRNRTGQQPLEFWKTVPDIEPPEPIVASADPTAVLRSLGNPPLTGQGENASRHLVLAITRAAQVATQGLAAPNGLLAEPDDEA